MDIFTTLPPEERPFHRSLTFSDELDVSEMRHYLVFYLF
jgi:hypothetical protein